MKVVDAGGRRRFLAGMAALGAGLIVPRKVEAMATVPTGPTATGTVGVKPFRIDVHHHLASPGWIAAMTKRGQMQAAWDGWTPQKSIDDMDRAGVETSIVSVTIPGVNFGDNQEARALARESNEFAAKMRADHPGRFGLFAALPLPDVDGSLEEARYALDTLKADGIGMLTSYGDKWLGDPVFDPLFEELNRRKAVVYTHPNMAQCCRNLMPGVPPAVVEYGTDTNRAIARLLFGGAAGRYRDLKLIFSHAGGTLASVVERYLFQAASPEGRTVLPEGPMPLLRSFHYDTAQAFNAATMAGLRKIVPVSQILFGTDFPYRTAAEHVKGLVDCGVFNARELRAIGRGNAARLLPHYRA